MCALRMPLNRIAELAGSARKRQKVQRKMKTVFDEVKHRVTIQLTNGREFEWAFAQPSLLLQQMISASPKLQEVYGRAANTLRDREWSTIVAYDEYVPGSKFLLDTNRKSMNLSFTFANLGFEAIARESFWLTPVTLLCKNYKNVAGGWSQLLAKFLEVCFLGPQGFMTAGVPIDLPGGTYCIKAKLESVLSDGDGHRSGLQWRGASSLKPCFRHGNVVKKGSDLAGRAAGCVEHDETDFAAFVVTDVAELWDNVDSILEGQRRLEAGIATFSKAAFEDMRKSTGLSVTAGGLLTNARLRPLLNPFKQFKYDWMHSLCMDAQITFALRIFVNACASKSATPIEWWEGYLADESWRFPKMNHVKMINLCRVFHETRTKARVDARGEHARESEIKVKPRVAELLGLYGLIRHATETKVFENVDVEMQLFIAACKPLDILLSVKRRAVTMRSGARLLQAGQAEYLRLHKATQPEDAKPKAHWIFDIAEQMLQSADEDEGAILLDALVVERIHLGVKAVAVNVCNTRTFETSVLERTTLDKLATLQRMNPRQDHLNEPVKARVNGIFESNSCEVGVTTFGAGDIVSCNRRQDKMGVICKCLDVNGSICFEVREMNVLRRFSTTSLLIDKASLTQDVHLWQAPTCYIGLAWYRGGHTK